VLERFRFVSADREREQGTEALPVLQCRAYHCQSVERETMIILLLTKRIGAADMDWVWGMIAIELVIEALVATLLVGVVFYG
jgi:hypothetical protein